MASNIKEKEFILRINVMLKKYEMTIKGLGSAESSVLAFYSPSSKNIYINKHNVNIFNDYYGFIETMLHENVHKINDENGVIDVYMKGEAQVHNEKFKGSMIDIYNMYCDESHTGGIDFNDKRNIKFFDKVMKNKMVDNEVFLELQKIFFEHFYIKLDENNKYKDNKEKYEVDDEGGTEI